MILFVVFVDPHADWGSHGEAYSQPFAAKDISSLQLSRNLGLLAKTAFVLLHKLR